MTLLIETVILYQNSQKNESKMLRLTKKFKINHIELEEKNQIISTDLQTLVDKNEATMKFMLDRKLKREVNLNSWVKKYDIDVGVKWDELEKLKEEFEENNKIFKKFEDDLLQQSVPYEIYKEIIRNERLVALEKRSLNMYASKIQTWWRFIVATKLRKKKKGRKGRKGKSKTKKSK